MAVICCHAKRLVRPNRRFAALVEALMKRIAVAFALILGAQGAIAQPRPSTPARSCAASRQDVLAHGAAVLGTGGQTYDRFVRDRSFCQFDEIIEPAWVPSRDTPTCFVGYRCKTGSFWDD
ncbi:hypothetical protein BMIN10S_01963 [Bosea minatitlanensis]